MSIRATNPYESGLETTLATSKPMRSPARSPPSGQKNFCHVIHALPGPAQEILPTPSASMQRKEPSCPQGKRFTNSLAAPVADNTNIMNFVMSDQRAPRRKTHLANERPPFERIALILQGGGALGSYQAGVYQALAEANLHPDWVAGISIGAVNSALIAGNPPERRVDRLREFWETVSVSPFGVPNFARSSTTSSPAASSIRCAHWASCLAARQAFSNRVCRPRFCIRTAVPRPSATTMSPR